MDIRYPAAMNFPINRRALLTTLGGASMLGSLSASALDLPISSRELWGWVRAQQVLDTGVTYLDTATLGPGLRGPLATEYRQREQLHTDPEALLDVLLSPSYLRSLMKRLGTVMGCGADELTLTHGATEALALVAHGLEQQLMPGDEVIVAAHAHGSAIYPWLLLAQRRGIVVKQVAFPAPLISDNQPLGLLAGAVTDKTRAIVVSHVQHTDGAVIAIDQISAFARQRGILTVVDGAQALGCVGVNIAALGCDFYATAAHKWLNGPYGIGLLYIRRELVPTLTPYSVNTNLGWSLINRFAQASIDDEPERSAWPAALAKFGCNLRFFAPQLKALEATLDFRDQLGADRIEARIRELAIYARLRVTGLSGIEILTPATPGMWAGILSLRVKGSALELAQRLRRSNRIATAAVQYPKSEYAAEFSALRVALHIYNSHDDVERFVRAIA